jgi:hypothetical protein
LPANDPWAFGSDLSVYMAVATAVFFVLSWAFDEADSRQDCFARVYELELFGKAFSQLSFAGVLMCASLAALKLGEPNDGPAPWWASTVLLLGGISGLAAIAWYVSTTARRMALAAVLGCVSAALSAASGMRFLGYSGLATIDIAAYGYVTGVAMSIPACFVGIEGPRYSSDSQMLRLSGGVAREHRMCRRRAGRSVLCNLVEIA